MGINRFATAIIIAASAAAILAAVHAVYGGSAGGPGAGAVLTIEHEVIKDEEVLRAADEVLAHYIEGGGDPAKAPRPGEAVVVRVTIRLRNVGDSPISYDARQYFTPYGGLGAVEARPITSTVHPAFTIPAIEAEEGTYLRFHAAMTDDLSHLPLLPGEEVVNTYYLIVSRDFSGVVEARARVCSLPGSGCTELTASAQISVGE